MEEEIILNKIIEDAESEAKEVIDQAQEQAKKIEEENNSELREQLNAQFEIMKKKVLLDSASQIERAEFEARNSELQEKKKVMDIIKEKVKEKIKGLDDETYINIIDEKIKKYRNSQDVELILPKKCYDKIKKIAIGYGMKVLNVTDEFDTGVIVKCGNIEYNYNFEENMTIMNEDIEKEIDAALFN